MPVSLPAAVGAARPLQFEHHAGDDDGDGAVADCFKPPFADDPLQNPKSM
jgi:hypothetical protein